MIITKPPCLPSRAISLSKGLEEDYLNFGYHSTESQSMLSQRSKNSDWAGFFPG